VGLCVFALPEAASRYCYVVKQCLGSLPRSGPLSPHQWTHFQAGNSQFLLMVTGSGSTCRPLGRSISAIFVPRGSRPRPRRRSHAGRLPPGGPGPPPSGNRVCVKTSPDAQRSLKPVAPVEERGFLLGTSQRLRTRVATRLHRKIQARRGSLSTGHMHHWFLSTIHFLSRPIRSRAFQDEGPTKDQPRSAHHFLSRARGCRGP